MTEGAVPRFFSSQPLPDEPNVTAPDGSDVRILVAGQCGSMAHFTLAPGQISRAVIHSTVEEIWYIIAGRGRMWRACKDKEETVDLRRGVSLSIPVEVRFQFRNDGDTPLVAVAVTMPPWPGDDEAREVDGAWRATV